jgi:hypothetical protein
MYRPDVAVLMRLEVARVLGCVPVWFLLDWQKDDSKPAKEISRLVERLDRISTSLERQHEGRRARNEPYADAVGVRVLIGSRVIELRPRGEGQANLLEARTATPAENIVEGEFEAWLVGRARQEGTRP